MEAIKRELLEETGGEAEIWEELPSFSPNPACYANRVYTFFALNTEITQKQKVDETEEIEFGFYPINEVLGLIEAGKIQQPFYIVTLFMTLKRRGFIEVKGDVR